MYLLMQQYLYGITEAVVQRRSIKKLLLKISKIHRKAPVLERLFNKIENLEPASLSKRDSSTDVFREFCEIFERL